MFLDSSSGTEVFRSHNSLFSPEPHRIDLSNAQSSLNVGDSMEFYVVLHAEKIAEQELCLLFVYREVCIHLLPHV